MDGSESRRRKVVKSPKRSDKPKAKEPADTKPKRTRTPNVEDVFGHGNSWWRMPSHLPQVLAAKTGIQISEAIQACYLLIWLLNQLNLDRTDPKRRNGGKAKGGESRWLFVTPQRLADQLGFAKNSGKRRLAELEAADWIELYVDYGLYGHGRTMARPCLKPIMRDQQAFLDERRDQRETLRETLRETGGSRGVGGERDDLDLQNDRRDQWEEDYEEGKAFDHVPGRESDEAEEDWEEEDE